MTQAIEAIHQKSFLLKWISVDDDDYAEEEEEYETHTHTHNGF